ncbi:MAG TPA: RagB/SusD family nutrient uptake outer membrane protein [Bacteroidales bacterium]|nr:RagB/SusD family nutrient uptake outer membrane protein [Bacteroidales bacterium]
MKKSIIYIFLLQVSILFTACEDYLDKKESALLTYDQVFTNPINFQKFVDDIYTYYHYWPGDWACQSFGGLGRIGYSSFEGASDLAEASRAVAGTNASFNLGNWSPGAYGAQVELTWPWAGSYAAIRRCNVVLEKVDSVIGLSEGKINGYKAEALFARAFFHFELIKRYGGVPYLTKSLKETDDLDLPREPYDTCVAKIVRDLDAALPNLPKFSAQTTTDFGRPTISAALALKAKVLLYAASPLNTESYDINIGSRDTSLYYFERPNTPEEIHQKWVDAATAAYELIKLEDEGECALADSAHYRNIFYQTNSADVKNKETLFCRIDGSYTFSGGKALMGWIGFSDVSASKGYGGAAGTFPTQNLIDMYEMADGSIPITGYNADGSPIINAATGYTEQNMWKNRDPRLSLTVLCNQDQWQDRPVQIWFYKNNPTISGSEMKDAQDYTTTGYLCKKTWPEDLRQGETKTAYMNWIWFRYTDVLLWYAEAMDQAFGPDVDGLGNGKTASWALNRIRNRMNPKRAHLRDLVTSDKNYFLERLMNERAIEFVYEEQRWWDVIRYKKGTDIFNKPVYGVRIFSPTTSPTPTTTFEINRRKIENRVFYDYMHKYPIPYAEIEKSVKLKQNPGW